MTGKGQNSAIIQLKLELLNYVLKHCGDEKQSKGFYICKRWLMFDPDARKELGEDLWKEMLEHYSITNIEQRLENNLRKREKEIREQAELEIEKLRAENEKLRAESYKVQTEIAKEKLEMSKAEKQAEEEKQQLEISAKQPPPEAMPIIAKLEEFKDFVNIEFDRDSVLLIVKPAKRIRDEDFQKINQMVRSLNGSYQSQGMNSHWKIPIPKLETPIPQ